MAVRWDTVQIDGQPMRVYTAAPSGPGPKSGVVVIQHGAGVDPFVQDVVHRLFRQGFVAAAPELYHRQPAQLPQGVTRFSLLKDKEIVADVNATVAHLRSLQDVRVGSIGIVGFCMGGRVVYLMAASNAELKAGAVFYGGNIMNPWGEGPTPFELTTKVSCPLIGFFGETDSNPTPDDVKKIDAELAKFKKPHEFHSYAEAGHSFQDFQNASAYREAAAKDSWTKMLAFFRQHLKVAAPVGARR